MISISAPISGKKLASKIEPKMFGFRPQAFFIGGGGITTSFGFFYKTATNFLGGGYFSVPFRLNTYYINASWFSFNCSVSGNSVSWYNIGLDGSYLQAIIIGENLNSSVEVSTLSAAYEGAQQLNIRNDNYQYIAFK